ncbi:hypothetical protein FACS1894164_10350 [Spirochaetia bacterium]|nr:hypothetical protein FACS1894164_10350 [Spirochaetia bacterium]
MLSSDQSPRIIPTIRGFSVSYRGLNLLSTINPVAGAERIAGTVVPEERTLYFCPSPLFGYGLALLSERLGPDSAILCVEVDENLWKLSAESSLLQNLLKKDPRIQWICTKDPDICCTFVWKTWGSRTFRRVKPIHLSGGWSLFPDLYNTLTEALTQEIATEWGNAMTLIKLGRRYIKNAIQNLALLPAAVPLPLFGSGPVLVLGAGPSLDKALDGLGLTFGKTVGSRNFKIICADTCLPALVARRIQPDLVVALESQHWNLRDFIGSGFLHSPLAMDLSAARATVELLGGPVSLFGTLWTQLHFFDRLRNAQLLPELVPPLGSVGLNAVFLALRLSSGAVITAGLDFAFSMDASHARSTPNHLNKLQNQNRFRTLFDADASFRPGTFTTQSRDGTTIRTDIILNTYSAIFKREFSGNPRLFTIKGPGLDVGTVQLSPEDAAQILTAGAEPPQDPVFSPIVPAIVEKFLRQEIDALVHLRAILSGEGDSSELEPSLDFCDYLWAHFPECAGREGWRPADSSFLKRVRAEIDPFITLFEQSCLEILR